MLFNVKQWKIVSSLRIRSMPKGGWREFDGQSTSRPVQTRSGVSKAELNVRVERLRAGKGGKTVTVIKGLQLQPVEARVLLKSLKAHCGTGGTLKLDCLELQGDQVAVVLELLKKEGYRPKQTGG